MFGGWVTFTAHLAKGLGLNTIYKAGKKTEGKVKDYGYGINYWNVNPLKLVGQDLIITAIDKNHYTTLNLFKDVYLVIHDPTELKDEVLKLLPKFKIITIRKTVQDFLLTKGFNSTFIPHPFVEEEYKSGERTKTVSISRIDFDKNIDLLLKANALLKEKIDIWGAPNPIYIYHKLNSLGFKDYYRGRFPKTSNALDNILSTAKFVIDMSTIKNDGGGTQYTFLEAIARRIPLILNQKWVEKGDTFKADYNCFVAKDEQDIVNIIENKKQYEIDLVTKNASLILANHSIKKWFCHDIFKTYAK